MKALYRRDAEFSCGVGNEIDVLGVIVVILLSVAHIGRREPELTGDDIARLKTLQTSATVIEEHAQMGAVIELDFR